MIPREFNIRSCHFTYRAKCIYRGEQGLEQPLCPSKGIMAAHKDGGLMPIQARCRSPQAPVPRYQAPCLVNAPHDAYTRRRCLVNRSMPAQNAPHRASWCLARRPCCLGSAPHRAACGLANRPCCLASAPHRASCCLVDRPRCLGSAPHHSTLPLFLARRLESVA